MLYGEGCTGWLPGGFGQQDQSVTRSRPTCCEYSEPIDGGGGEAPDVLPHLGCSRADGFTGASAARSHIAGVGVVAVSVETGRHFRTF